MSRFVTLICIYVFEGLGWIFILQAVHEFVTSSKFVLDSDAFIRFQFFIQQADVSGEGFFLVCGIDTPERFAHFHGGNHLVDPQAE